MAFPATQKTLNDALTQIQGAALQARAEVERLRNLSATGATNRSDYVRLQRFLQRTVERWDEVSSTPGLAAYVRDQYDDPTLDVVAEFSAMRAAAISVRDWVFNNIPTDTGSGAALIWLLDNEGNQTSIMVSSAQAAGFRAVADAFIATIV